MNQNNILAVLLAVVLAAGIWFVISEVKQGTGGSGTDEPLVYLSEGQRDGPFLVEKIYPDHVDGLVFREYPIAVGNGAPMTLYIGESASNGCTIALTLIRIENGLAVFSEKVESNKPCPICLSGDTYIGTPSGQVPVKDLREGMDVWTTDASGSRAIATILRTGKTAVPKDHEMVHLVLDGGREVFASPGHPLADGRLLGNILPGDMVDGARVASADRVPYNGGYTYDILPSGDTGTYFANGILLKSTIMN
jgi:hypothetical protein